MQALELIKETYKVDNLSTSKSFCTSLEPVIKELLDNQALALSSITLNDFKEFLESLCTQQECSRRVKCNQSYISQLMRANKIGSYTHLRLVSSIEVSHYLNKSRWHKKRKVQKDRFIKLDSSLAALSLASELKTNNNVEEDNDDSISR